MNDPLRIYHTEPDGITAAAAAAGRNAYSYALGNRIKLNEDIDYLRHAPGWFLRAAANYVRFSLHVRKKPAAIAAVSGAFPLGGAASSTPESAHRINELNDLWY